MRRKKIHHFNVTKTFRWKEKKQIVRKMKKNTNRKITIKGATVKCIKKQSNQTTMTC